MYLSDFTEGQMWTTEDSSEWGSAYISARPSPNNMGEPSQLKAHEAGIQTATYTKAQTMDQAAQTISIKMTTKAGLLSTSYFPPRPLPFYLWPPPEQAKVGKQESKSSDRTQSILVVDDDPNVLAMVTDILLFEGYNIETATNGAEALAKVDQTMPALVLLDMRMPVLSGWDFARVLKERDIQLPILVMTAARDAHKWAEEIGASGYVAKPFHLPDLLDAVEAILTREDGGSDQSH